MKRCTGFLVFIVDLFLSLPAPSLAEVDDGTHVDPELVRPLMTWVEDQLGVKVPTMPQVIASREHFNRLLERLGRTAGRPQSAYVPGTVYMDSERWDHEDSTQLSLLVHELVHHAQLFMNSAAWPCPSAREDLAYRLQNRWLEQQGHSPFVNVAWIERVSSCPAPSATTAIHDAGFGSSSGVYESIDTAGMTPGAYRAGGAGATIGYTIVNRALGRMLVAGTPRGLCAVYF
ncbi:MAG: hypothetical protein HGA90_03485, partial [Alphaproteobacteria bacterium]|nr:hypothetical protein [Alphaproteobacteria bacterium]